MDTIWVIVFAVIAVVAILFARRANVEEGTSKTVGFNAAIGAGVIGLGILLLAMPWAAGNTAAFDFVESTDFAVLTGADYVLGVFAIIAGLAIMRHKESGEES